MIVRITKVMRGTVVAGWLLLAAAFIPGKGALAAYDAMSGGYDSPYFQADFVQELSEWTSALVNPALLYRVNQFHLGAGGYGWSVGTGAPLGYGNVDFLVPIRRNQTIGLTYLFSRNTIEKIDAQPGYSGISRGTVSYLDSWFVLSYAVRTPIPWFVAGINIKERLQRQFEGAVNFSSPGFDIGLYMNPLDHYWFGDLGLSLTLQDVFPAIMEWKDSSGAVTGKQVNSTRLRFGVRYSMMNDLLVADVEGVMDNALQGMIEGIGLLDKFDKFWYDTIRTGPDSGKVAEHKYGWTPAIRVSGHFRYQLIPQLWLKFGWNNNNIPYLGVSANFMYFMPEWINYITVDYNFGYSFIEYFTKDNLGGDERGISQMLKISTDFGPTREQRESRRLYDQLLLAPMDVYNEAMRLYAAGKWWDASFAFGKLLSLYPNFHLNDKATYNLGNCYKNQYLNSLARDVYKQALEEYTTSEMRAKYLYGLECIDYREGKFDDALKNHAFIVNLYPDNDIRPDADYVAGQVHFERKNLNVSEQLFKSIKSKDNPYLYAQYTLSIINVEAQKEPAAIQNLTAVISDSTQDPGERLLQDASNLKLGHLYFEQGSELRKAVEAYQRVDQASPYADEALLGTAWAWIKVGKADICLQVIERLLAAYPQSSLLPEANLVKGYALMLLKRYPEAVENLQKCVDLSNGAFIGEREMEAKKGEFERYLQEFQPQAQKMYKNAMRKPTSKTLEERPELKTDFDKFAKENRDFFVMGLLVKSNDRFFKEKGRLVEDANYALAKAKNMMKGQKSQEIYNQGQKKQEQIDEELRKAQEELKKLEQK